MKKAIDEVIRLTDEIAQHQEEVRLLSCEREAAMLAATKEGHSRSTIAKAAGLHRSRVTAVLNG